MNYHHRWKPVPGYEGYYMVSNKGKVRSVDREVTDRKGVVHHYHGRHLSLTTTQDGHHRVCLSLRGKVKSFLIHRLVLMAFVGRPKKGQVSRHIDGKPASNGLKNLRWATVAQKKRAELRRTRLLQG